MISSSEMSSATKHGRKGPKATKEGKGSVPGHERRFLAPTQAWLQRVNRPIKHTSRVARSDSRSTRPEEDNANNNANSNGNGNTNGNSVGRARLRVRVRAMSKQGQQLDFSSIDVKESSAVFEAMDKGVEARLEIDFDHLPNTVDLEFVPNVAIDVNEDA